MDSQSESVLASVTEELPAPPPVVKMKKVFDNATGQYTLVPKKEPVKVIKAMPPSMRHFAKKANSRQFLTRDEVRAFFKRVVKRRRQKKVAEKTKWKNFQLTKENR